MRKDNNQEASIELEAGCRAQLQGAAHSGQFFDGFLSASIRASAGAKHALDRNYKGSQG
jgi:hypothetical protein